MEIVSAILPALVHSLTRRCSGIRQDSPYVSLFTEAMWVLQLNYQVYRSTMLIEHLRAALLDPNVGLAYFFCEERSHHKQTLKPLLASIIVQLIRIRPCCLQEVEAAKQRIGPV